MRNGGGTNLSLYRALSSILIFGSLSSATRFARDLVPAGEREEVAALAAGFEEKDRVSATARQMRDAGRVTEHNRRADKSNRVGRALEEVGRPGNWIARKCGKELMMVIESRE